jgi:MoaA/NifB/PqqE/SkfB family radical SAM enzyme/SAM-dependent methyltransferase
MKALIKVGYGCNENCTFCHTLDVRHIDGGAAEVHAKIERAKKLGHTMVVLSGGEPTMRPELLEWAAHVAQLDMDFGLITNGLMLAYRELVEKLLALRLRYVYLSLHGGSAEVHNRIVRTDAFADARTALANLSGRGLDLTVNCVVVKQNLEHLREMVDVVRPFPDATLKFSMVQPKGGGAHAFDALTPRVSDVAARVVDAIAYGAGMRLAHDGIPLCLLPGLEDRYDDLKTHRFATMVEIGEPDFFPVDDRAKIQPPPCEGCALRGPCPGLYRGYHESFGDSELRPVAAGARSNSFNYVFEGLVTAAAEPDRCPLREDGTTPWDRGRHLFVRNGARIGRFRTDTRDFSDAEIEAIKHHAGQIYVDISRKTAPDDFAADLVKLERSALCGPCPERDRCTGLYEPANENVFDRDDARVRAMLAALEGDVLDVGCGDAPYLDVLQANARIRYVGIDPDAARIAGLHARFPAAELHVATAESFSTERRFHHILILRSWNHLRDPETTVAQLMALLRPGGSLLVVDNVAFGLARTPEQTGRGQSSPARFEHYRNDAAAQAQRRLSALALTLIEQREVTPNSANQWFLRYRI